MFNIIKWPLLLFFLAVSVVVGMVFAKDNAEVFSLHVFGLHLPALGVGLWLVIMLLIGITIGLLISFIPLLFSQYSSRHKDRKILHLEQKVKSLRVSSLKQ